MPDPGYIHGAHTLVKYLPTDRPLTGVIVGVLRGVDAEILLTKLPNLERLYLVDDWSLRGLPEGFKDSAAKVRRQAHDRMRPYGLRVRWLECSSAEAAVSCAPMLPDFVYLDGDHSEAAVHLDIYFWSRCRRPGGILSGHDYGHPDFPGVKQAVDAAVFDSLVVDGTVWIA